MQNERVSAIVGRLKKSINLQWMAVGLAFGAVVFGVFGSIAIGLLLGMVFSDEFARKRK